MYMRKHRSRIKLSLVVYMRIEILPSISQLAKDNAEVSIFLTNVKWQNNFRKMIWELGTGNSWRRKSIWGILWNWMPNTYLIPLRIIWKCQPIIPGGQNSNVIEVCTMNLLKNTSYAINNWVETKFWTQCFINFIFLYWLSSSSSFFINRNRKTKLQTVWHRNHIITAFMTPPCAGT